ncbi:MAG: hypothetical protein D4R98_02330 [Comamonadaceae bacterium]|nr:MAG: hypothetical protein D4R98_02330 [Comamonadaceae bacterium]
MRNNNLILRQQQLCERSAQLRFLWAQEIQCVKLPLSRGDNLIKSAAWISRKPVLPAVGAFLILAWQPKRAVVWGCRILWGWNVFQGVSKTPLACFAKRFFSRG